MLYRLVYSSTATEKMPKPKLYKILLAARTWNARSDVTGLLVFADGIFLQVLEGERDVVQELMKKISADRRHTDVIIVSEGAIEKRLFPTWRMAYVSTNAKELATWAGLRDTTTVGDTLAYLRSTPENVPDVLVKLIGAISDT